MVTRMWRRGKVQKWEILQDLEGALVEAVPEVTDLSLFYRPKSMAIVGCHYTRGGLAGFTDQALHLARRVGASAEARSPRWWPDV
jgi:hypothetical protein